MFLYTNQALNQRCEAKIWQDKKIYLFIYFSTEHLAVEFILHNQSVVHAGTRCPDLEHSSWGWMKRRAQKVYSILPHFIPEKKINNNLQSRHKRINSQSSAERQILLASFQMQKCCFEGVNQKDEHECFWREDNPKLFCFLSSSVISKTGSGGHLSSLRKNILGCKSMPFVPLF